jgi:hypothetical protein
VQTDIQYITETASLQGEFLIVKSSQPSGRAVGQGLNDAAPVATVVGTGNPPSGTKVAGLALDAVVNIDQTRQHRNYQRTEQVVGENVALLKDGWVWTNMVIGTPAAGDKAYLGPNGKLGNSQINSLDPVGRFDTSVDTNGYAKVVVKIP